MLRALLVLTVTLATSGTQASEAIEVHCMGSGERVYLIGGGPAFTTWHLEPIQQQFENRYRLCRFDMRGVGDNADLPLAPDTHALEQWLADMAAVLPEEPTILWGHSWGALQILLYAERHPERVKGLILSNPVDPALKSLEHIEAKRHTHDLPEAQPTLEEIGTPAEARKSFRRKIASYFLDGQLGWDYSGQFTAADANNALNVQIWEEYRKAPLTGGDLKGQEEKISAVIHCRHDVLQPESRQAYAQLLRDTPETILENCAHFPWVEVPEAYYRALASGLEQAAR